MVKKGFTLVKIPIGLVKAIDEVISNGKLHYRTREEYLSNILRNDFKFLIHRKIIKPEILQEPEDINKA